MSKNIGSVKRIGPIISFMLIISLLASVSIVLITMMGHNRFGNPENYSFVNAQETEVKVAGGKQELSQGRGYITAIPVETKAGKVLIMPYSGDIPEFGSEMTIWTLEGRFDKRLVDAAINSYTTPRFDETTNLTFSSENFKVVEEENILKDEFMAYIFLMLIATIFASYFTLVIINSLRASKGHDVSGTLIKGWGNWLFYAAPWVIFAICASILTYTYGIKGDPSNGPIGLYAFMAYGGIFALVAVFSPIFTAAPTYHVTKRIKK